MRPPTLVITGASGFLGRHLLEALKDEYRIFGIARRSQVRCGAPLHPNIRWFQADIGEADTVATVFRRIADEGGADVLIHLAAHYDFTGEEHPEYWRTNVDGLRHVITGSHRLGIRRLVFSSSVAACRLPPPGAALDEDSPADGGHVYSRSKKAGEDMVRECGIPSTVVRLAALFSDWCEYPPLFMFLGTWLSGAWNRRVLGGRGLSAVPYLHVSDAVQFVTRVLDTVDAAPPVETLIASPDQALSHRQLFDAATAHYLGHSPKPILMPKVLCGPGMWARDVAGRLLGERPFERPWMARYIDTVMSVDARRTRARLGWAPRPRLLLLRRMPFLLENLRTDPIEWNRRNRAALKEVHLRPTLRVHRLLERHEQEIAEALTERMLGPAGAARFPSYQRVPLADHQWNHRVVLRHLMNAIRTGDKGVFLAYCRDLAERRAGQGFAAAEVCGVLEELAGICVDVVDRDPDAAGLARVVHDVIERTVAFGCDQVLDTFERVPVRAPEPPVPA